MPAIKTIEKGVLVVKFNPDLPIIEERSKNLNDNDKQLKLRAYTGRINLSLLFLNHGEGADIKLPERTLIRAVCYHPNSATLEELMMPYQVDMKHPSNSPNEVVRRMNMFTPEQPLFDFGNQRALAKARLFQEGEPLDAFEGFIESFGSTKSIK